MTPYTSIEALSCNSEHLVELEEELLQDTYLVEAHEASCRPSRTPSKTGDREHGAQTVQRTEVQEPPRKSEELNRDRFLRFRDGWVRNRARDIREAGSPSFNTCSEDTASITALNEFYTRRIFFESNAGHRDETEVEIEMVQGSRDFGSSPKDVAAAEKLDICRIACREKGRRVLRTTCRRHAKFRD